MAAEILPDLNMATFNSLREAWRNAVAQGEPIPSLQFEASPSSDAEHDELLYLTRVSNNPGRAVERALGGKPDYKPGGASVQNARKANMQKAYIKGMRAIMRLVVTGKDHGATDLDALVAGGPVDASLADVFDDAVKTLVQVQFDLPIGRNDRVKIDGRPVISRSAAPELGGPSRTLS